MSSKSNGRTPVTMRDVAKAAGVSRMTVSRALKSDSPVSKETRDHILKIVDEMNYVPDQMAGSLTTGKSGFVGVLLPSLNNLHFAQTVQAITDELEEIGLQLLLGHTDYSPAREEEIVETMLRRRPEAMVLSYDGHTDRTVKLLKEAGIPIIEIWETPEDPIQHTVGFSNEKAAYDMTKSLLSQAFKHILFLGEEQDDWSRGAARRTGFERAMREAGDVTMTELRFGAPPLTIENGAAAADIILKDYPDADCIFCVSDMAAYGVQSRMKQLGKSVPEDVSIVGFGNFEVSRFSSPQISTVVVDPVAMGRQAGELIARLLRGTSEVSESVHHIVVSPELEFRGSSATSKK